MRHLDWFRKSVVGEEATELEGGTFSFFCFAAWRSCSLKKADRLGSASLTLEYHLGLAHGAAVLLGRHQALADAGAAFFCRSQRVASPSSGIRGSEVW